MQINGSLANKVSAQVITIVIDHLVSNKNIIILLTVSMNVTSKIQIHNIFPTDMTIIVVSTCRHASDQ